MVFNAAERANNSVAQTSKKISKRNEMNWVAATLERLVSESTFKEFSCINFLSAFVYPFDKKRYSQNCG